MTIGVHSVGGNDRLGSRGIDDALNMNKCLVQVVQPHLCLRPA